MNFHAQNIGALRVALREIYEETTIPVALIPLCPLLVKDRILRHRKSEIGGISHASELETSLMMYLRKGLVKLNKLTSEPIRPPSPI